MFAPRLLLVESFQQVEQVEEPKHSPIIPLSWGDINGSQEAPRHLCLQQEEEEERAITIVSGICRSTLWDLSLVWMRTR